MKRDRRAMAPIGTVGLVLLGLVALIVLLVIIVVLGPIFFIAFVVAMVGLVVLLVFRANPYGLLAGGGLEVLAAVLALAGWASQLSLAVVHLL